MGNCVIAILPCIRIHEFVVDQLLTRITACARAVKVAPKEEAAVFVSRNAAWRRFGDVHVEVFAKATCVGFPLRCGRRLIEHFVAHSTGSVAGPKHNEQVADKCLG
jgi:hypothetical protein